MDCALRVALLLVLVGFASTTINKAIPEDDFEHCKVRVKQWRSLSLNLDVKEDESHILRDLLFFLHIPRTGGRTYFHCFLKKLYSGSLECPRSYDKLRFDPSKPKCRLLVTHDDYSMMSKLPKEKASVVTILRQPIDRIFSTYEFSLEVAARFLVHPNLTSATRMAGRLRAKTRGVSTLDIWPWKYLVPWMREDLFARREARRIRGQKYTKNNDSYNMDEIVMPLHEYINDPIARDIIHNGATFQVAGLTNNSFTRGSHEVRHCVTKYQSLGKYVLDVAKKRLDDMLYVGLTENHRESATMFANVVGSQVISQLMASGLSAEPNNKSEQSSPFPDSNSVTSPHENNNSGNQKASKISSPQLVEATNETMTVGKLMESYETCISSLRKSQTQRRISSLKQISPANFTKEARRSVPEALLQEIMSLNTLDMELYKYAEQIFARKHNPMPQNSAIAEEQESVLKTLNVAPSWKVLSFTIPVVLFVLLISLFVNAKRRTFKLKI